MRADTGAPDIARTRSISANMDWPPLEPANEAAAPNGEAVEQKDGIRILVIDDSETTRALFTPLQHDRLFRVHFASSLRDGRRAIQLLKPALTVLDIYLRDGDGLELLRDCQLHGAAAIVIANASNQTDRILALEKGALDFIPKPVDGRELILKLKRFADLLAHGQGRKTVEWRKYGIQFSFIELSIYSESGHRVGLTGSEARLLRALFEQDGKWIDRDMLLKVIANRPTSTDNRTVDTIISRLRKKLAESGCTGTIRSIRNVGYLLSGA